MKFIPDRKSKRLIEEKCKRLGVEPKYEGHVMEIPEHNYLRAYAFKVLEVQKRFSRK